MKLKIFCTCMVLGALALGGCKDKKNEPIPTPEPAPAPAPTPQEPNPAPEITIKDLLTSKYGAIADLTTEQKGNYTVATFTASGTQSVAWFDNAKQWALTETKISADKFPQRIKDSFDDDIAYKTWAIKEYTRIERPNTELMYIIEAEQAGQNVKIYYTEDGRQIKAKLNTKPTGDTSPYLVPQTTATKQVHSYLNKNFPQAKVLDIEQGKEHIEVEIQFGFKRYELFFRLDGTWLTTQRDFGSVNDYLYKSITEEARTQINQYIAQHYKGAVLIGLKSYTEQNQRVYEADILHNHVETTLYFDADLKFQKSQSNVQNLSETARNKITKYISDKYPSSAIVSIEQTQFLNPRFEVVIIYDRHNYVITFDSNGDFTEENKY